MSHSAGFSTASQARQSHKHWQRVIIVAASSLFSLLLLFTFLFNTNAVLSNSIRNDNVTSGSCATPWLVTDTASLNDAIGCYNAMVGSNHTISVTQSFTLTSSTTPISNTTGATLHLAGNGYSINGEYSYRIFTVQSGKFTIDEITLSHGADFYFYDCSGTMCAGAIRVKDGATVTVTNSIILSHHSYTGGAIFNQGSTTIITSIFSNNSASLSGGAIWNNSGGIVTIISSSFIGNVAVGLADPGHGGAIRNYGTVIVHSSTFNGNYARDGGGISSRGAMTITNSTFSDNSAGSGGGIYFRNTLTLINSTFSSNTASEGGNIKIESPSSTLRMNNSILANAVGGDCDNDDGIITDEGFNLVEDGSCGFAVGGDPLLGLLQDNGGETLTQALLPGSPAIDAGDCDGGSITEDQRGVIRPIGAACDIGAFEAQTMLVSSVSFVSAEYTVSENAETALITVILNALPYVTATVDFATSDGTATAGVDYEPVSSTLTFAPGVTEQTFTVTILHNDIHDEDRTINLALSNPVNATLGATDTAVLTITDDGDVQTIPVSFNSAEYTVSEDAGTTLVTVTLDAPPMLTATVDFATSNGTAISGIDYEPVSGTLSFAPGVTEQIFTVTILDNDTLDGDRTINLALSNPVNATLGTIDTAILTIVDDGDAYTIVLPLIVKP